MKKMIFTVAAFAMVLNFTSCKQANANTAQETADETAISKENEGEILVEEIEAEVELDTTIQIDSLEIKSTETTSSEKE
ncbi:hypothetical protein [Christiangramia aquimixticola]|uniref:hypothetical protein n=1 Tax=Christiangramia aquimixticola TaxID=1697558 RepID=UPI003AA9BD08